jgi:Rrf2 family transcriptional regulator, cysteine metabolism repressor
MMLDIHKNQQHGRPISLKEVSGRTGISGKYLEQLVVGLKSARLLRSVPGRGGGYLLAKPAENIAIGDVISASIGPVILVDCLESEDVCLQTDFCECRLIYQLINRRIDEILSEYTLASLTDKDLMQGIRDQLNGI